MNPDFLASRLCSLAMSVRPTDSSSSPATKLNETSGWRSSSPYCSDFRTTELAAAEPGRKREDNADEEEKEETVVVYPASCFCGRVKYEVRGSPLGSKLCHCRGCQLLHGAPFEWVSIFEKGQVRFAPTSLEYLYFYNSEMDRGYSADQGDERVLPVKVSCSHCRTPIADEGRRMWLAFSTLFRFTEEEGIPEPFRHGCHLFYGQRCMNLSDNKTKWLGHKGKSPTWEGG